MTARLLAAAAALIVLGGCARVVDGHPAQDAAAPRASSSTATPRPTSPAPSPSSTAPAPPHISLGAGGLAVFPGAAAAWVAAHPGHRWTPTFRTALVGRASSLWLTGDESFGNLSSYASLARSHDATMVLTVWNIPLRWDGLSTPSDVVLAEYKAWIQRIAQTIGTTRALLVLEPDALWFYDRLASKELKAQRIEALSSAIGLLHRYAPATRVYLDAGTASGSVTPERMALLLDWSGLRKIAGFAVNVSSYAPTGRILAYAGAIRAALQARGLADPRFVVDTGRNGAPTWDNTWCNPVGQRLGAPPQLMSSTNGMDFRLWVKAPGTSDGDCGPAGGGAGSTGGQFLPGLAYRMITG